ncbi:hypothetical protein O6H91_16G001900 [Diphasiastrum complanatum]|uniref:Uncharacterized protein n=1 Tax=Diphasiastrum complanatum TaxID=34168 RepID=A0ACC2B979_DIPCM|nr:hypothetical protein O6H91_16G001900 [Diphasiastrum complanatum]
MWKVQVTHMLTYQLISFHMLREEMCYSWVTLMPELLIDKSRSMIQRLPHYASMGMKKLANSEVPITAHGKHMLQLEESNELSIYNGLVRWPYSLDNGGQSVVDNVMGWVIITSPFGFRFHNLSHDIIRPLNSINNWVQLLMGSSLHF